MGSWRVLPRWRRVVRAAAVGTVGTVVAGLAAGTTPALAGPPAQPDGSAAASAEPVSQAVSAAAEARRTGHRVEIVGLRTQTGQVFANPEGTYTAEEYAQPVRVRRADGSWAPVDLTLRRAADGSVAPAASPVDLRLSGGGTGPFATVTRAGRAMGLGWPGRLPAPVLSGDTATYPQVLPGVDLAVRATLGGFAEALVVRDRQAAANPALRSVRFTTSTRGVSLRAGASGSLSGVDSAGTAVFASGTATMWDARSRQAAMPVAVTPGSVTLTPDRALLSGPDTVYPVTIDPSVSVDSQWTMINKKHPDQSYWSYDRAEGAKVGYTDQTGNGDDYELYRSIFLFGTSSFAHKHVLSTFFSATLKHSWSCTATRTDLEILSAADSNSTWNNNIGYWGGSLANASTEACDDVATYTEWGSQALTDTVQAASDGWTQLILGLRAYNEGSHNYWKKFDPTTAKLSVTYNTPPNVPTDLTVDGRACATGSARPYVGTTTPRWTMWVSDPDPADILNAGFHYAPIDGTITSDVKVAQGGLANGSTMVDSPPAGALADGGTYKFAGRAGDGTDVSAYSPQCEFTVDTTRPSAVPTVASADGLYLADGNFHGGVGQPGSFTLGANGVGDVQSYVYGLADPPTTEVQADAVGGTATVTVTPRFVGLTTLYVRSRDRAGNLSDLAKYTFMAGSATPPVARWSMDEASGATLADASGHGNTATLGGGYTRSDGRVGGTDRAVTLDGGTGYAATSGPVVHTDRSYTVAAWVRLTSKSDWASVAAADGTHVSPFYFEYLKNDDRWAFGLTTADTANNGAPAMAMSKASPRLGAWTHLVGVYDAAAGEARLYVDGALQGTVPVTATWDAPGAFEIGRYMWPDGTETSYFPGQIDDVRVWDRVVFGDEIGRIVDAVTLVGEWDLDEYSGTTAADSSGNDRTATMVGSGITWEQGHIDNGAHLTRAGEFATAGPVLHTDQSFTVTAWVKLDDKNTNYTAVGQDGSQCSGFYLQYRPEYDRWVFLVPGSDAAAPAFNNIRSTSVPQVGVWTHLAGVYDQVTGQVRLYVNGQLEASMTRTTPWDARGVLRIGAARWQGTPSIDRWSGSLDDVRVHVGVLSDAQIAEIANQ